MLLRPSPQFPQALLKRAQGTQAMLDLGGLVGRRFGLALGPSNSTLNRPQCLLILRLLDAGVGDQSLAFNDIKRLPTDRALRVGVGEQRQPACYGFHLSRQRSLSFLQPSDLFLVALELSAAALEYGEQFDQVLAVGGHLLEVIQGGAGGLHVGGESPLILNERGSLDVQPQVLAVDVRLQSMSAFLQAHGLPGSHRMVLLLSARFEQTPVAVADLIGLCGDGLVLGDARPEALGLLVEVALLGFHRVQTLGQAGTAGDACAHGPQLGIDLFAPLLALSDIGRIRCQIGTRPFKCRAAFGLTSECVAQTDSFLLP